MTVEWTKKAVEVIAQSLRSYVDQAIADSKTTYTKLGIVTNVMPNGKYMVKVEGAEYSAPLICTTIISIGNEVVVLFDGNRKYILGKLN